MANNINNDLVTYKLFVLLKYLQQFSNPSALADASYS